MALSRYALSNKVRSGKGLATSSNMSTIRFACDNGSIKCERYVVQEGQRLDQLSGLAYQTSNYWWVIAAASGIGWGLQVPPGTVLSIPVNISDVLGLLS